MEIKSEPILKKRRADGLKWTESKTQEFLELVVDLVKDVPSSLEKPTAQKFYTRVMEMSRTFKGLNFLVLKNKMRCLRGQYINAVQWRAKTGAELLAAGKFDSVADYLEKICPHFYTLQQIYGQKINAEPQSVIHRQDCDELEEFTYLMEDERNSDPIEVLGIETNMQPRKVDVGCKIFDIEKEKLASKTEANEKEDTSTNLERERFFWEKEKFNREMAERREMRAMEMQHEKEMKRMEIERELKIVELKLKYKLKE